MRLENPQEYLALTFLNYIPLAKYQLFEIVQSIFLLKFYLNNKLFSIQVLLLLIYFPFDHQSTKFDILHISHLSILRILKSP